MTRASIEEERIAEAFVSARCNARPLAEYPGQLPSSLPSAYRCQDAAISRWGERIGGWKASGRLLPYREHLIGPVFESSIRYAASGETVECPMFTGGISAFEPEIVVRVGQDAPPEQLYWTLDEGAQMVGELCIGAEVASSPLPTLIELGATSIVSDFGCNSGVVVGSPIENWKSRDEVAGRVYVDDELVSQGTRTIRDVLAAFAFTLGKCANRGRPLLADMVIATGTLTYFDRVDPGQRARLVFKGYGDFTCTAIPATSRQ